MEKRIASATTWGLTKGCGGIDFYIGDAGVVDTIADCLKRKAISAIQREDYDLANELTSELVDLQNAANVAFAKPDENEEETEDTEE